MLANLGSIIIGTAIFGYAAWALVKFINKSKKGKCAACELEKTCSSQSSCGPSPK
ncbi:FeoB-associated Cys-rich membrane protein [Neobacillus sp. DY30]|uniref:FeoB-associated Cys-rich membrane protein n=1 Tax=Neobacillus sp. DY30 TaxID=3047871 RepID=UPI0024BF5C42|nr:FeoB-associated Cys-rich membrane protein [Neobacillus sp. DY30]WHY01986.1 FeoB-associated Cys-rich membrane protein [Neobacillus sp. DY30]